MAVESPMARRGSFAEVKMASALPALPSGSMPIWSCTRYNDVFERKKTAGSFKWSFSTAHLSGFSYSTPFTTKSMLENVPVESYVNENVSWSQELVSMLEKEAISIARGGWDPAIMRNSFHDHVSLSNILSILDNSHIGLPDLISCGEIQKENEEDVEIRLLISYKDSLVSIPASLMLEWEFIQAEPVSSYRIACEYHIFNIHNVGETAQSFTERNMFVADLSALLDVCNLGNMIRKQTRKESSNIDLDLLLDRNAQAIADVIMPNLLDDNSSKDIVLFFFCSSPLSLLVYDTLVQVELLIKEHVKSYKPVIPSVVFQLLSSQVHIAVNRQPFISAVACSLYTKLALSKSSYVDDKRSSAVWVRDYELGSCVVHVACIDIGFCTVVGWTDSNGYMLESGSFPLDSIEEIWLKSVVLGKRINGCQHIVISFFSEPNIYTQQSWLRCSAKSSEFQATLCVLKFLKMNASKYPLDGMVVGDIPFQSNESLVPVMQIEKVTGELAIGEVISDLAALAKLKPMQETMSIIPIHVEAMALLANFIAPLSK